MFLLAVAVIVGGFFLLSAGKLANAYERMQFTPKGVRFKKMNGFNAELDVAVEVTNPASTEAKVDFISYDIALGKGGSQIIAQVRYDTTEVAREGGSMQFPPLVIPARRSQAVVAFPVRVNVLTAAMAIIRSLRSGEHPHKPVPGKTDKDLGKEETNQSVTQRIRNVFVNKKFPKTVYITGEVRINGIPLPVTDYEVPFA